MFHTRCDRKVPGSKRPHETVSIYLRLLNDNKVFVPYIANFASPDAHAVFGIWLTSYDIESYGT